MQSWRNISTIQHFTSIPFHFHAKWQTTSQVTHTPRLISRSISSNKIFQNIFVTAVLRLRGKDLISRYIGSASGYWKIIRENLLCYCQRKIKISDFNQICLVLASILLEFWLQNQICRSTFTNSWRDLRCYLFSSFLARRVLTRTLKSKSEFLLEDSILRLQHFH